MKILLDMNLSPTWVEVTPRNLASTVISALRQLEEYLDEGALVIIDEAKLRARILPLDMQT